MHNPSCPDRRWQAAAREVSGAEQSRRKTQEDLNGALEGCEYKKTEREPLMSL